MVMFVSTLDGKRPRITGSYTLRKGRIRGCLGILKNYTFANASPLHFIRVSAVCVIVVALEGGGVRIQLVVMRVLLLLLCQIQSQFQRQCHSGEHEKYAEDCGNNGQPFE